MLASIKVNYLNEHFWLTLTEAFSNILIPHCTRAAHLVLLRTDSTMVSLFDSVSKWTLTRPRSVIAWKNIPIAVYIYNAVSLTIRNSYRFIHFRIDANAWKSMLLLEGVVVTWFTSSMVFTKGMLVFTIINLHLVSRMKPKVLKHVSKIITCGHIVTKNNTMVYIAQLNGRFE